MFTIRRRLVAVLVPVVLVTTAGCGSGGDTTGDERARTIEGPASEAPDVPAGDGDETLSEAELRAALLTVQDLPTGYTLDSSPDEDDDEPLQGDDCAARFEALDEANEDPAAEAEVDFEGGFGVLLSESLSSYDDKDQLEEAFDKFASLASDCPSFTDTDDDGTTTKFTLGALSFPKLGDETLAITLNVEAAEFNGKINIVVVQLGRNLMSVLQGGLTADAAVLEQAARKGLEKLAAATG